MALVVLACGGLRSGSTLQYNLVGDYVERLGVGVRVGLVQPEEAASFDWPQRMAVAKSHHARDPWPRWCTEGRVMPLYTVRDHAARVRSMSRKFGIPEQDVTASDLWVEDVRNRDAWLELGARVQSYDLLTTEPVRAIRELCPRLGVPFSYDHAEEAARASSRLAALAIARRQAEGTWDPVWLIHWDHITDGSPG